jgi:hypothetical protein
MIEDALRALEAALLRKRRAGEILLDADAYDRWGAANDTPENRARMEAQAAAAEAGRSAAVAELESRVRDLRRDAPGVVARWADLHDEYLRRFIESLGTPPENTFESTAKYVAAEERDAWRAVERGEKPFVDENVYYVKIDPARYAAVFGFDPAGE